MDKKKDFGYVFAKELKKRDNPKDFKPSEAIVVGLSPVVLSVLDNKVTLTEGKNLIISEWWQFRRDIDKTFALSEDIPDLLEESADLFDDVNDLDILIQNIIQPIDQDLGVIHSYNPIAQPRDRHNVEVRNAFSSLSLIFQKIALSNTKISEAITKNKNELLALKLDLQINDKVIIIPSSQADIFFLIDKVVSNVPG